MVIRLVAITPRRAAMGSGRTIVTALDRALTMSGFAGGMIRRMSDYPSQKPTTSGYVRTGTLGRNWKMTTRPRGRRNRVMEVTNPVDYAIPVEGRRRGAKGERQAEEMARRDWPTIDTEVAREWPKHRRLIVRVLVGTDERVRRSRRRRIR